MHVRSIRFAGFGPARYNAPFTIELPPTGIVCVVGPNESGKSSILEAVDYAVWGKDLRAASLVHETGKSSVTVVTDIGTVTRQSRSPKISLDNDGLSRTWDTLTPAQEAINALFGPLDLWLSTSVFTTADRASDFCASTDKFRKLLLETALDVGAFDAALAACRADLAKARTVATRADAAAREGAAAVARAEAAIGVTARAGASFTKADAAKLAELEADAEDAQTLVAMLNRTVAELDVEARGLKASTEGVCSACGQMVNAEYAARENARVSARRAAIVTQRAEATTQIATAWAAVDTAGIQRLRDQRRDAESVQPAAAAGAMDLSTAKAAKALLDATTVAANAEVHVLEAAERALGYKGIRASIVEDAVKHLSTLASVWFQRIGGAGEIRISLEDDKIDMTLTRVGGGTFKAGSSGVRRRVSVAVLLGLVDLVTAARGRTSTLFFDEVFDAIDATGAAGVTAALNDIAVDRCCLVITHSATIAAALQRSGAKLVRLQKAVP